MSINFIKLLHLFTFSVLSIFSLGHLVYTYIKGSINIGEIALALEGGMKSLAVTDATAARKTRKAKVHNARKRKETTQYPAASLQMGLQIPLRGSRRRRSSPSSVCLQIGPHGRSIFSSLLLFLPFPVHENNRFVLVSMSGSIGKLMKLRLDCW